MPKNPHADFTPTLAGYSGISPFRFWCQTALPLTYDDSLSYYELLNKVVNYLNHTIEDLTNVENNTSELAEAYEKLQKYVNDYFDDLDVEAELRTVLDGMAEDGTLDALLDPLVENQLPGVVDEKIDGVVAGRIDGAVAGQIDESVADQLPALVNAGIPEEVSRWLTENVNPVGSAVMVDSSLTISGAAADAKVTGDKVSELKESIDDVQNMIPPSSPSWSWEQGSFQTGGNPTDNAKRVRTIGKLQISEDMVISTVEGYRFGVFYYAEESSTYVDSTRPDGGKTGWIEYGNTYTIEKDTWFTVTIARISESGTYTADPSVWGSYIIGERGGEIVVKINNIDNRVSELESKDLDDRTKTLENGVYDIENLISKYIPNWQWEQGSYTSAGALTDNAKRLRTVGKLKIDADLPLHTVEGYRFGVFYYAEESSTYKDSTRADGGGSGWINYDNSYTIEKNVWFTVNIARISESGTYTADPSVWREYVYKDVATEIVKKVLENEDAISELSERVTVLENPYPLPDYWKTYLSTKIPAINEEIYKIGNHGTIFAFFTDYHYVQSEYNYQGFTWLPNIFKEIDNKCPIENYIFGGDILTTESTKESARAVLEKFREDYRFLNMKNIYGNHDNNPYGGSAALAMDDVYSILFRGMGMENSVELTPDMYWHYDNKSTKIRFIALNTGVGDYNAWIADSTQAEWFIKTLSETPNGYTVVIMPHVVFGLSNGELVISAIGTNIKSIVDAYVNKESGTWNSVSYNFANAVGTISMILTGHAHNDGYLMSDAGYPIICTVCDAMWGSNQNVARGASARGTVNEHAFDIVCLDTTAKTIKCVRVGSGNDRTFTYTT